MYLSCLCFWCICAVTHSSAGIYTSPPSIIQCGHRERSLTEVISGSHGAVQSSGSHFHYTETPILQLLRYYVFMSSTVCAFVVQGRTLMFHAFGQCLVTHTPPLLLLVQWTHVVFWAPLGKRTEGAADLRVLFLICEATVKALLISGMHKQCKNMLHSFNLNH